MPDLRQDPITGRWVIIAEDRGQRPIQLRRPQVRRELRRCPFCAGNERETPPALARLPEAASERDWQVRVVPNKYPFLADHQQQAPLLASGYTSMAAVGAHELVIESPEHLTRLSQLTDQQLTLVCLAYRQRLREMSSRPQLAYGLVFKNTGAAAGASLEHLHSQLIGLPLVPHDVQAELIRCRESWQRNGRCIFCQVQAREIEQQARVVAQTPRFVAYCPFASRFAYETWVAPIQHASCFWDSSDDDLAQLAQLVRTIMERLEWQLKNPAYNVLLRSGPFDRSAQDHYHWHIEILPRITEIAGFELGTGCLINSKSPEAAAAILRQSVLDRSDAQRTEDISARKTG